ncbi:hypothetical protein ABBQ32_012812 [Trebouxia sp. C0010 RCD-2024]
MALRRLFREQQKLWPTTQQVRWASTAPSIYDRMVQVTVVDVYGQRHVLRALTGHTLVDVLSEHQELLGNEEVTESPEGRGALECVVSVPNEFLNQIPQTKEYLQQLRQIAPSVTSNCRLGSKIILTKEMNDMQVALHEVFPWRTI